MSTPLPIADDVRRFVLTSVPSVPYLEAMLLFHNEQRRPRTGTEVAALLYVQEQVARDLLEALCSAGVIARNAAKEDSNAQPAQATKESASMAYRYAAEAPLAAMIDKLAAAYAENLVGIANLIHDRTQRSAQRFADAFKLRKDP
jgi:hypothetical protein